jgi:hypothetical protein
MCSSTRPTRSTASSTRWATRSARRPPGPARTRPSRSTDPGRELWLDRLDWVGGRPVVRGPTATAQPAPAAR